MPYTNIWNETLPTGNEAANTIAAIFRSLKLDLDQRISDLFGGIADFTVDPLRGVGIRLTNDVQIIQNAGAPTSGVAGTGVGSAGPGSLCINTTNPLAANTAPLYINVNTKASPTWAPVILGDSV